MTGKLQNEAGVIHVVAERMEDLTPMLSALSEPGPTISDLARADEVKRPQTFASQNRGQGAELGTKIGLKAQQDSRTAEPKRRAIPASADIRRAMPKGRNFH